MSTYKQVWDLESIFPGGSNSQQLIASMEQVKKDIVSLEETIGKENVPKSAEDGKEWSAFLDTIQVIGMKVREAGAFIGCLNAQDIHDKKARQLQGTMNELTSIYRSLLTTVEEKIVEIENPIWEAVLEEQKEIAFSLEERRRKAKDKLSPDQEKLVGKLAIDGYHAWGGLYDTIVGQMTVPFEEGEKTVQLSVGQAANKLNSNDRDVRQQAFHKWEDAWKEQEELCASALNHLAGFRLNLYEKRGWKEVLKEPLEYNRMTKETLDAMWGTITKNKERFLPFLERKAQLLGVEKLAWHDVDAPIGSTNTVVDYDEAAKSIIEQFQQFSPKLAEFTEMTFKEGWIEAEDRPGKRPGGFCTSFPVSGQTRIFMTYDGTPANVATLAHELGHAYHQHCMKDMAYFATNYAMNVAETASTFAEMIVADAAVKQATTKEEKVSLLENKIGRSIAFFMNIHARFLFETRFYEKRKSGLLTADELSELMVEAQKEAYCNSLSEYHPRFWASKLHFYITDVPFYNFPYTFGYLFSLGVYAQALEHGTAFEDDYIALLRDTASMTVEELASKHLKADITSPHFWQKAIDLVASDVDEFLALTKE